MSDPTLFEKRTIEAKALKPILKALVEKIGLEETRSLLRGVNEDVARREGKLMAEALGSDSITAMAEEMATWGEDGSLEEDVLEKTDKTYVFNITRCRFAELYGELGLRELGFALSCCRDDTFIEGFNPRIKLYRKGTIMQGNKVCDFRYVLED